MKSHNQKPYTLTRLLNLPFFYSLSQLIFSLGFFKQASKFIQIYPHRSIIEIGCGTGNIIQYLNPAQYLGIDIDPKYITYTKDKFPRQNFHFLAGDATKINKIPGYFDLVLLINTAHHLTENEIKKILHNFASNIKFSKFIIIDSLPVGLTKNFFIRVDRGSNFRKLNELSSLFSPDYKIIKKDIFKRWYWPYEYPVIVAQKINPDRRKTIKL